MRSLTFCDVAMFYCRTGGGIRTYYDAKLDWFSRQDRHRYVLIVPGERSSRRTLTPMVTVVEARGISWTRASDSYRTFIDFAWIRSLLREFQPDVVETGDPWISGPLVLLLRRIDRASWFVSSFFHSDPIPTYLVPLVASAAPLACGVSSMASRAFYRAQRLYDVTVVSSRHCTERLAREGVTNVHWIPFGVDSTLFAIACRRPRGGQIDRPRRLLYVGRLDRDKQIDLLLAVLPRLLEETDVSVTVAGTGAFRFAFEQWAGPRLRYVGYVRDRDALAALYGGHDVFLAPGAYETFGLAALEAAAAGLVVVGPDRGGTAALLRLMDAPFTFKAGDADDFLAAVRAALDADWARASRASRDLAATFGAWPDAIARLVHAYEEWLEARPCSA
jgi:alpha-1,6-mannosyltransferase